MGRKGGRKPMKRQPPKNPLPYNAEEEIVSSFSGLGLGTPGPNMSFEDLGISPDILKGVHAYALERPSPIQQRAIPYIKNSRDVILQAQSGMGKTAAFCIGILERIDVQNSDVQSLVLAPTRELAEQIGEVFVQLARYTKIKIKVCTGGYRVKEDRKALESAVHIVVGTLGRILSLIGDKSIQLLTINILALDEADKMVTDRTFTRDISQILGGISGDAQIILASATMPPIALEVARVFMRSPKTFLINNEELTLEGIKQFYISMDGEQAKIETLRDIYPFLAKSHVVIFCSTRSKVKWLCQSLLALNIDVAIMSGDMFQADRNSTLKDFRNGKIRVLITSDVIGRGVDVQQLYCVINYDLPINQVDYIHRVGRGGRFGRKGLAITLADAKEKQKLQTIAEFYHTEILELEADLEKLF